MLFVKLDKDAYYPGAKLAAFITVSTKKRMKARRLVARLACHEQRLVRKAGGRTEELSAVCFEEEKEAGREMEISGESTFSAEFSIPRMAEPTSHEFGEDNRIFVWKLHVKLDVPFGIDENAEKEVVVRGQRSLI